MPAHYHIDKEEELVTIRGQGEATLADARNLAARLLADEHFSARMPHLIDLRGLELFESSESAELRDADLRSYHSFLFEEYAPSVAGSIAVVVDETLNDQQTAALYRLTCAIEHSELFDNYELALKWLFQRDLAPKHVARDGA